ncbi:MAG: hypothetical protein ABUL62_11505 [Myxococcales bacterium]
MPKKKHRKKARSSKRATPHKAASHVARARGSKLAKRHTTHAKPEAHSFSLLRAIKRRRAAERGQHPEPHKDSATTHRSKKGRSGHHVVKRNHHHAEPVVTEKSFENMLAFRRFQNHAR